jgi:epoxyqueuosine reductase QueG
VSSGLGELGRNNILVADRFGSRVRIGAVTTDLALTSEEACSPRSLGVRRFCELCKKCSENCPTGSLTKEEPVEVRGVVKWPTKVETCYAYWRRIGTDCGVCMAVCPFSHRDNWFHGFLRWLLRAHPILARSMLRGDDLVYGRKWKPLE